MHLGESENKIRTYADAQQEDIIRDWNTFMRVDIKRATTDALNKTGIELDDLKLRLNSAAPHDNKM